MAERTFTPGGDYGGGNWLQTPGVYLLAFTTLARGKSNTGKEKLDLNTEVIAGTCAGQNYTEHVYITKAALGRLNNITVGMGLTSENEFDLNDDASCKKTLLYRPFKAKIKVKSGNTAKFAEIDAIENMNADEGNVADQWVANKMAEFDAEGVDPYAARKVAKGDFDDSEDDPGFDDDSWPDDPDT